MSVREPVVAASAQSEAPDRLVRSATWQGIRTVGLEHVAPPEPGPRDVVLAVEACGICGSDVHRYLEGAWAAAGMPLGHEFAGRVVRAGAEVTSLAVGDRVAVNPAGPCGACDQCRRGRENLCADGSRNARGGLGDEVLVREPEAGQRLFVLPDALPFEEGAFLEPLSVAVRAVRHAGPVLDEPVVVVGLGTIGQCVLRVLLAEGVREIVGIDVSAPRLQAARAAGVDVLDGSTDDVRAALLARWGRTSSPYQPDAGAVATVFECSGAPSMIDLAVSTTRAGGTLVLAGLTREPPQVDVNTVVQKELRLLGTYAYTGDDAAAAFGLLRDGRVRLGPLVSHRFPLSRVAEAFAAQADVDGCIKVVVHAD